jgi:hypothetical protein
MQSRAIICVQFTDACRILPQKQLHSSEIASSSRVKKCQYFDACWHEGGVYLPKIRVSLLRNERVKDGQS